MSYIESIVQHQNRVVYCGPNNGTELYVPGGLVLRLSLTAANVLEFTVRDSNITASYKAYNTVFYGNGLQENFLIPPVVTAGGIVWQKLDLNTMLTDGSDIQHVVITAVDDAAPQMWRATAWRPTPTKVVITGELVGSLPGADPTVEGIVTEMHRVTFTDNNAAAAVSTFNGKQYRPDEGWIPEVAGYFLNGSLYTGHGYSWNALPRFGYWGLVADTTGISVGTHTFDVVFRRYPPGCIRRFGNFT